MPPSKLTTYQVEEIINRYLNNETYKQISVDYCVDPSTIRNVLIRNNIDRRKVGRQLFPANHKCFDDLTEHSLYWLGFIAADGHINVQKNNTSRIMIGLAYKDVGHLEKFKEFTGAVDNKIQDYYHGKDGHLRAARISVRSKEITDRLIELGVKGPKLSTDLTDSRHFWRGAIDGDGYVTQSGNRYSIALTGQHYILEPYKEFLYNHIGIESNIGVNGVNSFKVATSGNPGTRVMRYIYGDSNVYLDRKKKRAYEILAWNEANPPGKYERKSRDGDPYR